MTAADLVFDGVTLRYGDTVGCRDVSLRAKGGRITVLLGENGSGKSSVLAAAAGLHPLAGGTVRAGEATLAHTRRGLADWRRRVGLVMHDPDDQLLGTTLCEDVAFGPTNLGLPRLEIAARVDRVLAALDLEEQHDASPASLSHGQKLRAAIAGIVAMDPPVLLLDEPTSGLDAGATAQLERLLLEMRNAGRCILLSTHDIEFAWRIGDDAVVMHQGAVASADAARALLADSARCAALGLRAPTAVAVRDALQARGIVASPAVADETSCSLTTKRRALASVVVCVGCCCGRVDRGRPAVPVDWLKAEFKRRKLLHHVHLTISGCLGPCDVPNVVAIASDEGTFYLGRLETQRHFEALVEWASDTWTAGTLLPLPPLLAPLRFERFSTPATAALAAADATVTAVIP
ncbi:MAG: ABC transporter ATP-binding protein [Gammaproteobacteria bacterium]|nr:ABC transporter ATP-binding protein [Gammaproteobacteria bacterium]